MNKHIELKPFNSYQHKPDIAQRAKSHLEKAIGILNQYHLLQDLSEIEQSNLIKQIRIRKYCHHQMIYHQNDPCHDVNILLEGTLKLGWGLPSGKYHTDNFIPAETIINIVTSMTHQPYVHDHQAIGSTVIANIPIQIFVESIQHNPKALLKILQLICIRTQLHRESLVYASTSSLRSRLARKLLFLVDYHSFEQHKKIYLTLKLSQENFAELLQTTRQSINKEFSKLSHEKVIEIKYHQIYILDYPQLKTIAEDKAFNFTTKFI